MTSDINHINTQRMLDAIGINELEELDDNNRFDDLFYDNLLSFFNEFDHSATKLDAQLLFHLFLGRIGGDDYAGKKCIDIIMDLANCQEFIGRKLAHKISNHENFWIAFEDVGLLIKRSNDIAHGQGIYSCYIEYRPGMFSINLPVNFDVSVFESRLIPYFPIFFKALKILKEISSQLIGIDFFYGDHPQRDTCLAFCSNKIYDYLLPDFESLIFFKNPTTSNIISWGSRKPVAYFRGTDTGSSHFKNIARSQRVLLCSLAQSNPDFIDAKITKCQFGDTKDLYYKLGVFGEREPIENIGLYKYNVDVDGNSNSWAGLVNKLYGGFGGVTLKVDSQEGYRQWFYNRLLPWVNYVPISADLSDILDKIKFLQKNDGIALGIQKNAANIFSGIDYEYLMKYSAHIIVSALLRLR